MKTLIFASIFAILVSNLFAQNLTHTVGMSASSISGAGFSYKYKINEDWAVKSTSFIIGNKNDGGSDLYFNLGGELQYDLYQTKKSRLYLLAGGSYWYSKDEYQNDIYGDKEPFELIETNKMKRIDEDFNLGVALGIEAITFDNISFNVDFGYHFINSLKDSNYEIGFGGGVGIGYTFGK
ncbi:MAG: hypothetical protein DWQ06_15440 [Calditrichaeota bacterium]|nr:MAG: hypothetical protein DWQ06_15440 [Calditrichota bacterium]